MGVAPSLALKLHPALQLLKLSSEKGRICSHHRTKLLVSFVRKGGSCNSLTDKQSTKLTCGLSVQGRWRQQCLSDVTVQVIHIAFLETLPLISLVCITREVCSPRTHKLVPS